MRRASKGVCNAVPKDSTRPCVFQRRCGSEERGTGRGGCLAGEGDEKGGLLDRLADGYAAVDCYHVCENVENGLGYSLVVDGDQLSRLGVDLESFVEAEGGVYRVGAWGGRMSEQA